MCVGSVTTLAEIWDEQGARVARLADGCVVSLAFLPEARVGDTVLLHLGVPVEVVTPTTTEEGARP